MFLFECEKQEFGIKPMNCPGHCIMFAHTRHSYRGKFLCTGIVTLVVCLAAFGLRATVLMSTRAALQTCRGVSPTSVCCTATSSAVR